MSSGSGNRGKGAARRREPPVDLEGVGPFAVRDLAPGESFRTGDLRQIEIVAVTHAEPRGVAVGEDRSLGVGDDQVVDVRLLGRLHEELLELEAAPVQPDPRPGARLEGTDQGRPLLHEEAGRLLLLPVDVLQGHEDEERDEDHDRPDDQPGRDHRPEPSIFLLLTKHRSYLPSLSDSGYFLINWIPQVDTNYPSISLQGGETAMLSGGSTIMDTSFYV